MALKAHLNCRTIQRSKLIVTCFQQLMTTHCHRSLSDREQSAFICPLLWVERGNGNKWSCARTWSCMAAAVIASHFVYNFGLRHTRGTAATQEGWLRRFSVANHGVFLRLKHVAYRFRLLYLLHTHTNTHTQTTWYFIHMPWTWVTPHRRTHIRWMRRMRSGQHPSMLSSPQRNVQWVIQSSNDGAFSYSRRLQGGIGISTAQINEIQ